MGRDNTTAAADLDWARERDLEREMAARELADEEQDGYDWLEEADVFKP